MQQANDIFFFIHSLHQYPVIWFSFYFNFFPVYVYVYVFLYCFSITSFPGQSIIWENIFIHSTFNMLFIKDLLQYSDRTENSICPGGA